MTDRIPGAPGQFKAVVTGEELLKMQSGEEFTITMTRDDRPIVEGTPYSKASVLPDALAQSLCPDAEDPTPADALQALYDTAANAMPKSGGTFTGPVQFAWNNLTGFRALNGVLIGGFRFDENLTCHIPAIAHSDNTRWSALVGVSTQLGTCLYHVGGVNGETISYQHKIYDGGLSLSFGIVNAYILDVSVPSGYNWASGWYIANSQFDDMSAYK